MENTMAIELSVVREKRRSGWMAIARALWPGIARSSRLERRGFFCLEERRRFQSQLDAWRNPGARGGPF